MIPAGDKTDSIFIFISCCYDDDNNVKQNGNDNDDYGNGNDNDD